MTAFLIFAFLVGAVLGQRFRVLVLLPFTFAIVLLAIPVCLTVGLGLLEGLNGVVLCTLALQAGYIFGSAARIWLAATRAARISSRPVKEAQSIGR